MQLQSNQSVDFNAETLQRELLCPVLFEPLSKAVTLVPCAHKVQQAAAETLFGSTHGGWLVQSEKPCPVCRVSVLGYMTDHSTRNIVKQLFELPESEVNKMLKLIKDGLVEKSLSVEADAKVEVPYPGKPAKFVHSDGDWSLIDCGKGSVLCRQLNFRSITTDSFIKEFSVLGYKDNSIIISLSTSKNAGMGGYLKQFDIPAEDWGICTSRYTSGTRDQLQIFFNILAQNNEIPSSHFEMIRGLVAKGTHL